MTMEENKIKKNLGSATMLTQYVCYHTCVFRRELQAWHCEDCAGWFQGSSVCNRKPKAEVVPEKQKQNQRQSGLRSRALSEAFYAAGVWANKGLTKRNNPTRTRPVTSTEPRSHAYIRVLSTCSFLKGVCEQPQEKSFIGMGLGSHCSRYRSFTMVPAGTLSKRSVDSNISRDSRASSKTDSEKSGPGPIACALTTAITKGVPGLAFFFCSMPPRRLI